MSLSLSPPSSALPPPTALCKGRGLPLSGPGRDLPESSIMWTACKRPSSTLNRVTGKISAQVLADIDPEICCQSARPLPNSLNLSTLHGVVSFMDPVHKGILRPWVRASLLPETVPSVTSLPGLQHYQVRSALGRCKNLLQEFQSRPLGLITASKLSSNNVCLCERFFWWLRMCF